MNIRVLGFFVYGLFALNGVHAQSTAPDVRVEAAAVRAEVVRSMTGLLQYTWTEQTEVSVKGDVKSQRAATCRYNADRQLKKRPVGLTEEDAGTSGISKRPVVRKKADMEDYIERAVGMIGEYVPPKPELVNFALDNQLAFLRKAADGNSQIELKNYYQTGDSVVFTYDPQTKVILRALVSSAIGGPKDPVTLDVVFETLPDGVNHVASTTLTAPAKKIQVKTKNVSYQKLN